MLFAAFLLSIFITYVNPGEFIPVINALKLGTIIPLAVFVVCLSKNEPISNAKIFQHKNTKLLLLLLVLLLLSVMTADVTLYAFEKFRDVLGYLFWYIMIVKLGSNLDRIKAIFAVYVLSHLIILILNPSLVLNPEARSYVQASPFLGDGNDFALSVCIAFPMCLYLYAEAKTKLNGLAWLGSSLVLIFAIIGTQSRGGTIALACMVLFLWWNSRKKFLGILIISFALAVVVTYAPDIYFDRMKTVTKYEEDESAKGRIMAWKSAIRMAIENPALGVGAGHFAVALGTKYRPPEYGDMYLPWLTAHSLYFLVLGELGLPGIMLFLTIIFGNYLRVNKLYKAANNSEDEAQSSHAGLFLMLNASLIGYAVGGAFLSVAYYPHLYIILGMMVASTYVFESATKESGKVAL